MMLKKCSHVNENYEVKIALAYECVIEKSHRLENIVTMDFNPSKEKNERLKSDLTKIPWL